MVDDGRGPFGLPVPVTPPTAGQSEQCSAGVLKYTALVSDDGDLPPGLGQEHAVDCLLAVAVLRTFMVSSGNCLDHSVNCMPCGSICSSSLRQRGASRNAQAFGAHGHAAPTARGATQDSPDQSHCCRIYRRDMRTSLPRQDVPARLVVVLSRSNRVLTLRASWMHNRRSCALADGSRRPGDCMHPISSPRSSRTRTGVVPMSKGAKNRCLPR